MIRYEDVFEKLFLGPPPLATTVKILLTVWFVILPPWLLFALIGTGMMSEGGKTFTFDRYAFIVVVWMYPVLVGVAYFFRRRKPGLVWLPMLAVIMMLSMGKP